MEENFSWSKSYPNVWGGGKKHPSENTWWINVIEVLWTIRKLAIHQQNIRTQLCKETKGHQAFGLTSEHNVSSAIAGEERRKLIKATHICI